MDCKRENIIVIRSKKSELKKVDLFLQQIFTEYKLPENCFNKVFLCISEAVINSIEHGNKGNNQKKVSIGIDCVLKEIDVAIKDEGDGFNIHELKNPTDENNILKESGRGIHIIKSISENCQFNKVGNCIQFKIKC